MKLRKTRRLNPLLVQRRNSQSEIGFASQNKEDYYGNFSYRSAGYIGSHTCVELQNAGYDVVVLDNLSNSSEKSLDRVKAITGKDVKFYKGDILDRDILNKIFENEKIDSCINFAGLKAVGESVAKPWEYYNNNIAGTLTLVDVMRQHGCKNIIFSSSATVYGDPAEIPITENCPKGQCTNLMAGQNLC